MNVMENQKDNHTGFFSLTDEKNTNPEADFSVELAQLKSSMIVLKKINESITENGHDIKTIPSIFGKAFDENFISDYLAYVLNPSYNGIGISPLLNVIDKYSHAVNIINNLTVLEKKQIEVHREFTFTNGRRLDILIIIKDKLIIGIENKVYSVESPNQTIDYAQQISESFLGIPNVLLFLTRNGTIPQSGDFHAMSYKTLINKLKKTEFDYRRDIRRKVIFDEFSLHVEENMINKETHGVSEKTKLYLEYLDTIKNLQSSFDIDSNKVYEHFIEIIRGVFSQEYWIINSKKDRNFQQVYKTEWESKTLSVHYEFWLSCPKILTDQKLEIMIDVEGPSKDEFLQIFDDKQKTLIDFYRINNFLYRPSNRNNAILFEVINNEFIPGFSGDKLLVDKLLLLIHLEQTIDDVISQLSNNRDLISGMVL